MPPSERAWSLARQNSGADAAVAAAAAVGKRPSLRIVPSGNSAPAGQRRVWVKRRGTSHATSVLVEADELVDDLKTKVLNRFPTTLLRTCDPADLVFAVPEEATRIRSFSPNVAASRKTAAESWPSPGSQNQTAPQSAQGGHSGQFGGVPSSQSNAPSGQGTPGALGAPAPVSAGPTSPNPRGIELHPEDQIVPLIDRLFPQGMTVGDAFEVYTVDQAAPTHPPLPIPPRQFKFRGNPPTPHQTRPSLSRVGSTNAVEQQPQQTPVVGPVPAPGPTAGTRRISRSMSRSESRSRSISRGRPREIMRSPKNPPSDRTPPIGTAGGSDSGVLLLPRQFRMVSDSNEKVGDDVSETNVPVEAEGGRRNANLNINTSGHHNSASISTLGSGEMTVTPSNDKFQSFNGSQASAELEVSLTHLSPNNRSVNERVIVPRVNVLIVEDNVINQKILEAFMRRKSVSYAIAKNGKEAVAMWRQGGFHLILMDIQLPVMTGLEATKEIRRLEYVNRIGAFSYADTSLAPKAPEDDLVAKFKSPVIIVALTASSASKDKSEALAAGCNDFLTKPVNLLWLEQKILEWGCMQALIDFDGWKHWIRKSLDDGVSTPSPSHSLNSQPARPGITAPSGPNGS